MSKLNNGKRKGLIGLIACSVTSILLAAVLITLTILEYGLLGSILGTVLGGPQPIKGDGGLKIYESDYKNKAESVKAGDELNVRIAEEGFTLLLNEPTLDNGTKVAPLPMNVAKEKKVSVFGKNSVNLVLGGSGSGGGSGKGKTIFDGLKKGGFEVNPTLKAFYEDSARSGAGRSAGPKMTPGSDEAPPLATGETPILNYGADVRGSFNDYNDAAIVVISRLGGESWDLPRFQKMDEGGIEGNHYLQLDKNEYDMLDMVTSKFKKVIVVLNTLTSFQCDFIKEYNNMENDPRIDAVLWIGGPGATGAEAIGDVLSGKVNPSGRTVDIYSRDFTKDPTWVNFGDNSQVNDLKNGSSFLQNGSATNKNFVAYDEGVYIGYRYYETRAFVDESEVPGSTWYRDNVVFPFGYGLSYTTFKQTIEKVEGDIAKGLTFTVKVENTGNVAGKDVVQLYVNKPYTKGGIEKAYIELVDFAKTNLLGKGESQTVTIKVDAYSLASYDYNDANKNQFKGYELEKGDYTFYVSPNSHVANAYANSVQKLDSDMRFENDSKTGVKVENKYTFTEDNFDDLAYRLHDVVVNGETRKGMSRSNFADTFPKAQTKEEREFKTFGDLSERDALESREHNNTAIKELAEKTDSIKTGVASGLKLKDLVKEDGTVDFDDPRWEQILDNLTYEEMILLANDGAFKTIAIESIGKNLTNESDGPIGFINFMPGLESKYNDNTTFACEIVIGSTWNKDLAYQMGKIVGENGLWGDTKGTGLPYSGWYAPAVNLHRSPFAGRNFEYYSEDPILSGKLAVNVINGAAQKGVYTDLKHFALNDQETNRSGIATYCTEQAFREIYLKPFEIAVKGLDNPNEVATAKKDGITVFRGTTGVMSSFNRVGVRWAGGDYRLMTGILREEWGFRGMVISDYKTDDSFMASKQMIYAGNDLHLASTENNMWQKAPIAERPNASSKEDLLVLRAAAKNILYTVASSNSVTVEILGYRTEWWKSLTISLDVIVPVLCVVWGLFAVCKFLGVGDSYKQVFVNLFLGGNKKAASGESTAEQVEQADNSQDKSAE